MSNSQQALYDDYKDYTWLCEKYNEVRKEQLSVTSGLNMLVMTNNGEIL